MHKASKKISGFATEDTEATEIRILEPANSDRLQELNFSSSSLLEIVKCDKDYLFSIVSSFLP